MTVTKRRTSTPASTPAPCDHPQTDTDGVEVEDFGLEFDPPNPSTNAVSASPPAPPTANVPKSASASVVWHLLHSDGRAEGPLLTEVIRLRLANGTLSSETLIWRPGMPKWDPIRTVAEFQTISHPEHETSVRTSSELMEWSNVSKALCLGLLGISSIGWFWGFNWFTGAVLFFVAHLIAKGFAYILEVLLRIEANLAQSDTDVMAIMTNAVQSRVNELLPSSSEEEDQHV